MHRPRRNMTPNPPLWERKDLFLRKGILIRAGLREEWDRDIEDPEEFLHWIESSGWGVDLVTVAQRLPWSRPKFPYPFEWDSIAAIPIATHQEWWDRQITQEARNKIRKAAKSGIVVRESLPDKTFLDQVVAIYKETPVRQNRAFKDFFAKEETLRNELTTYPDRARYFGAFLGENLVGFLKLVPSGVFARTMGIMASVRYREKSPMNALLDAGVAFCAAENIRFLAYGKFSYGKKGSDSLQEFKRANGFENILLPRYHLPLTPLGRAALRLNLHKPPLELAPRGFVRLLLRIRDYHWRRKAGRWNAF